MGLAHAKLKITNLFNKTELDLEALVDTGATFMGITEEMALQLGFDTTEVRQQLVTFADGTQHWKPKVAPIEIAFGHRTYVTEAIVLADEALRGVLPLGNGFAGGPGQQAVDPESRAPGCVGQVSDAPGCCSTSYA